jgi:hypothetical protein
MRAEKQTSDDFFVTAQSCDWTGTETQLTLIETNGENQGRHADKGYGVSPHSQSRNFGYGSSMLLPYPQLSAR